MSNGCKNLRNFCKSSFSFKDPGLQNALFVSLIFEFLRLSVGVREDLIGWDVHEGDGLAHYARACTDVTFRFPFGVQELMGIAARGNFDLTQHSEGSGKGQCITLDVSRARFLY